MDAMLGAFGHTLVHLFVTVPFLRKFVTPLLPKPGDGPPEAFRDDNQWKFSLSGWTQEEGRGKGKLCQVQPAHACQTKSACMWHVFENNKRGWICVAQCSIICCWNSDDCAWGKPGSAQHSTDSWEQTHVLRCRQWCPATVIRSTSTRHACCSKPRCVSRCRALS